MILKVRCDDCGRINLIRRPHDLDLIQRLIAEVPCPHCHPEALNDCCAGCRYPFSLAPRHSKDLCFTCYQLTRRRALQSAALG